MKKPTYTAVFERGREGYWEAELAEVPGVHTWGRTLVKTRAHIREATAVSLDVEEDAFDLVEDLRLPKATKAKVARALRGRERAHTAAEEAVRFTREAAEALVRQDHLSTRDAAALLGVSHQRVQQVLAG